MGVEIERKFLVGELPADLESHPSSHLRQGYLVTDGPTEVRVRDDDGACTLTVKSSGGLARAEVDVVIGPSAFDELWPLTEGARVTKRRVRVPLEGGLLAEIDVFAGALDGLVVVEVEFPDEATARDYLPPAWFGAEVTDDARYKNKALARAGRPPASG